MTTAKVWVGDRLLDAADATVSFDDHGVTVGDGVFETIKLSDGIPFTLTRHLRRLAGSAARMGIPMPGEDRLAEAVAAVCASHDGDGFLRVTLTAGPAGTAQFQSSGALVVNGATAAGGDQATEALDEGRGHVLAEGLDHLHDELLAARDQAARSEEHHV